MPISVDDSDAIIMIRPLLFFLSASLNIMLPETTNTRHDKALFDILTVVGTLIVGLLTGASNSSVEFAFLTNLKEAQFLVIFLHSVAEYAGFNQVCLCLSQFVFNAMYDVDAYNFVLPVISLATSLGAFFLRAAVGWVLTCYGSIIHAFPPYEAYSNAFFVTFGIPLYTFILCLPFEIWYIRKQTLKLCAKRTRNHTFTKTRQQSRRKNETL